MRTSECCAEIYMALAKAQGCFEPIEKDRTVKVQTKSGGTYTFDYATLDSVLSATRPALTACGLGFVQPARTTDGHVIVTTRIFHTSGQWIEEEFSFSTEATEPQTLGSLITYAKRYGITSMLGVTAEEDDDGNAASWHQRDVQTRKPPAKPPTKPAAKPVQSNREELGDFFAGGSSYNKAKKAIAAAKGNRERLQHGREWAEAEAEAGRMTADEIAEILALIDTETAKRDGTLKSAADIEAEKDLQAAAAS